MDCTLILASLLAKFRQHGFNPTSFVALPWMMANFRMLHQAPYCIGNQEKASLLVMDCKIPAQDKQHPTKLLATRRSHHLVHKNSRQQRSTRAYAHIDKC